MSMITFGTFADDAAGLNVCPQEESILLGHFFLEPYLDFPGKGIRNLATKKTRRKSNDKRKPRSRFDFLSCFYPSNMDGSTAIPSSRSTPLSSDSLKDRATHPK